MYKINFIIKRTYFISQNKLLKNILSIIRSRRLSVVQITPNNNTVLNSDFFFC